MSGPDFEFKVEGLHPVVQATAIVCLTVFLCATSYSSCEALKHEDSVNGEVRKAEVLAKACSCPDGGAK